MRSRIRLPLAAALAGASIAGSELLFARLLLPATGGGPGVFLPVLFLFATIFPIGSEIARLIGRSPGGYRAIASIAAFHALLMLLIGDPLRAPIEQPIALGVVIALLLAAGPLLLLLSATVPLLSPRPGGRAIVSASNIGGLVGIALGAFGESFADLTTLRLLLLAAGIGALVLIDPVLRREPSDPPGTIVRGARRSLITLAAAASALLGATSTLLTADLGGIPLLWALPLAAYFLAWSVAFSERRVAALIRDLADDLAPAAGTLMLLSIVATQLWSVPLLIVGLTCSLFFLSVSLLARVAERIPTDRPEAAGAWREIGIGGAIGAALSALLAPIVFVMPHEIGLAGAAALLLLALVPRDGRRYGLSILAIAAIVICSPIVGSPVFPPELPLVVIGGVIVAIATLLRSRPLVPAIAIVLSLVAASAPLPIDVLWQSRSLFGPLLVIGERYPIQGGEIIAHSLISGRTLHGSEVLSPSEYAGEPTTFYHRRGPLGGLVVASPVGPIASIGMGVGTTAAYASAERPLTFVEIDPSVIEIAKERFGYLDRAGANVEVIEGEGRRWLASASQGRYSLLIIDAFNGDAIPIHLLTVESLRAAAAALRPGGLIAIHVSSRNFDLAPALAATAGSIGLAARQRYDFADPSLPPAVYSPSEWVAIGAPDVLSQLDAGWLRPSASTTILRDERADLLALLKQAPPSR